jgi:hypothetical protein
VDGPQANDDIIPNSWSLDDKELLCTLQPAAGGSELVLLPTSGGKILPFLTSKANTTSGQISPDGKWVAYVSDEFGGREVYVTTFPTAAGKWQVSSGGGIEPRWRGDGKEMFYVGAGSTLTAVSVNSEGTFFSRQPQAAVPDSLPSTGFFNRYVLLRCDQGWPAISCEPIREAPASYSSSRCTQRHGRSAEIIANSAHQRERFGQYQHLGQ